MEPHGSGVQTGPAWHIPTQMEVEGREVAGARPLIPRAAWLSLAVMTGLLVPPTSISGTVARLRAGQIRKNRGNRGFNSRTGADYLILDTARVRETTYCVISLIVSRCEIPIRSFSRPAARFIAMRSSIEATFTDSPDSSTTIARCDRAS